MADKQFVPYDLYELKKLADLWYIRYPTDSRITIHVHRYLLLSSPGLVLVNF